MLAPAARKTVAPPPLVPAVSRAISLLDLLAQDGEAMNVTQLASRLSLPKSSVHGLVHTLAACGYLRRNDDGTYFIGAGVMALARAFVGRTTAAQAFDSLWQALETPPEETVILSVLDGADVVYVAARNGDRPLGLAFRVGMRLPAHLAASGKVMLAFLDPHAVRALYPQGRLPGYRPGVPAPSMKALLEELAQTRERGFSIDDQGIREGVYCVGAPVFDASGEAVAGLGVCVHKALLDARSEPRHRKTVVALARALTQRLGGSVPGRYGTGKR